MNPILKLIVLTDEEVNAVVYAIEDRIANLKDGVCKELFKGELEALIRAQNTIHGDT